MPTLNASVSGSGVETSSRRPVREWICIAFVFVAACVSWIPRCSGPIDLRWDGGTYYILGTSLAEGKGYRLLNEPGEIEAIQYPPLLPAIVALHQQVLGTSEPAVVGRWLRLTYFLFSVGLALASFALARLFLPLRYAVPLALISVSTYEMTFLSTLCFAELPFALATVLCAYWSYKPDSGPWARVGAGAAAIAAYLLRGVGIALLAAWVFEALFRKRFRTAALRACVSCVPVLLWQGYIQSVEHSVAYQHPAYSYQRAPWLFYNVSYATNLSLRSPFQPEMGAASLGDMASRVVTNAAALLYNLGELVLAPSHFIYGYHNVLSRLLWPVSIPWWPINGVVCLFGCAVIAGIGILVFQRQWLPAVYLTATLMAVCITPWPGQVLRYFAPTTPFVLLALFGLFRFVERRAGELTPSCAKFTRVVGMGVASGLVVACIVTGNTAQKNFFDRATFTDQDGTVGRYRLFHFPPVFSSMQKAMIWLKRTAPSDSVIAVSMPHWVYLNTGIKTVMPPLDTNPVRAQKMLDSVPTRYLILEHMLMEQDFNERFPRLIRSSPDKWQLVYTEGKIDIYRRTDSGGPFAAVRAGS